MRIDARLWSLPAAAALLVAWQGCALETSSTASESSPSGQNDTSSIEPNASSGNTQVSNTNHAVPPKTTLSPNKTLVTPADDPNHPTSGPTVRLIGRFDSSNPNAGAVFSWSGSTMLTRVLGTGISIKLTENGNHTYNGNAVFNYYDVYVDGVLNNTFKTTTGSQQYVAAQNLTMADHIIRVTKRTEVQFGGSSFNGFVAAAGGNLLPAPLASSRRIEFIGDSITCGYGIEGNVSVPSTCAALDKVENADATYASLAAAALGADYTAVAFSGKGVAQNVDCTGDPYYTMPVLYQSVAPMKDMNSWDFNSWIPQAVVINLGTNDYNLQNGCGVPTNANFVGAWTNLLTTVRSHYPAAGIFCTVGPELHPPNLAIAQNNIVSAVKARNTAGDANVYYFALAEDANNPSHGCDYHPTKAVHQQMASVVVATLKEKLNW